MALAGVLEIQMMASVARLSSDMTQAKAVVGSAMKSIEASVASAKSVLATLGVGVGVGYFVSLIKGSIDALDHLHDLSKATNILVGDLAGLRLAAKQSGGDLDSIAASINKLSQNMGKDSEKFKALGVSAKDPLEAFKQLSDVFVKLQDPQLRAAVMAAALGKSWAGAAPLLAEGGKKIQEMVDAGKRGSKVTEEMTAAADAFNDKLAALTTSAGGATTSLVSGLLPTLQLLADNFTLVRNVVLSLIAAKIAQWASAAAAALYTTVTANMAKAAATLAAAEADAAATAASVALTTSRLAEMRAAAAAAGGQTALAIVTNGIVPMQVRAAVAAEAHAVALGTLAVAQRAASVSGGIAAGVLGLLGGPIGWITLLLGLGATAWAFWGKSAEDATKKAERSIENGLAIAKRLQDQAKFGSGDTGTLNEALAAAKQQLNAELDNMAHAQAAVRNDSRASAESIVRDLAQVEKSYAGAIGGARDVVDRLSQALEKAKKSTGGLTDEQKRVAAAGAAFLRGDKEAKLAAAELLKYENALRSLEEQLGKFNSETVEEQTLRALSIGSLKGLTAEHGRHLVAVAKQVDAYKTAEAVAKSLAAAIDAIAARQDALNAGIAEFSIANRQAALDMEFETSLLGKNDKERELAIALRKIEIDYRKQAGAISEVPDITQQTVLLANLNKIRASAVTGITSEIDAKTTAGALNAKALEQLQFELKLIGLTNVEREQAVALRALELTGVDQTTDAYKEYVAQLKNVIAAKSAADEMKALHVGMWQDIDRVAHDTFTSIFDSGKSAFDRLRDTLKNGLYSLLYQMTLRPFLVTIATSIGGAGVAQAAFPGASSGAGGLLNLASTGNSLYSAISGGSLGLLSSAGAYAAAVPGLTSAAVGSQAAMLAAQTGVFGGAGLGATISSAGGSAAAGTALSAISTALPYIGIAIAAASMLGLFGGNRTSAVGTGYNFFGGFSQSGGLDLRQQGVTNVGIDQTASGNQTLSSQVGQALVKGLDGVFTEIERVARASGLDTSQLATTAATFAVSTGMGQAEENRAIEPIIAQVANQLAESLIPNLQDYSAENESAIQTLIRLGGVMEVTNRLTEITGNTFGGIGWASIRLRDDLVKLMGGLQNASVLTQSYYENFFSDSERLAIDLSRVNDVLTELGLSAIPKTRDQFRMLVEAQDLSTVSGQEMFAALMQLSPAFAAVTQQVEQAKAVIAAVDPSRFATRIEYMRAVARSGGVPGFAGGGIASGWSMVGERGPELANFTSPARIYTAADSRAMAGGDNSELLAAVDRLTQQVARLERTAAATAASARSTDNTLLRVTRGGESMLTEAAA